MAFFANQPGTTSSIMNVVRQPSVQPRKLAVYSELNDVKIPSVYNVYPPPVPSHSAPTSRVNPLRPEPPERLTCVTETVEPNYHNEVRRTSMERTNFHRFHNAWSRYYYGSKPDKEIYNRFIREGLKEQMKESETRKSQSFQARVRESDFAVEKDRNDLQQAQQEVVNKHTFLTQYRDANKQMMEEREQRQREVRQRQTHFEKEQLKYNPINWSCSLK